MRAQVVADDILKIAKRLGINLTPMQLMKLVYIAHGWHLAMFDRPLFSDRIEAWRYGPVIPNLYHLTKKFGGSSIPPELIGNDNLSNPSLENFLTGVVEDYGRFSGIALSNLTHRSGTPWSKVFEESKNNEIGNELISQHYKGAKRARQASPASA